MTEHDCLPAVVAWRMGRSSLMAPEDLPAAVDEAACRLTPREHDVTVVVELQRQVEERSS